MPTEEEKLKEFCQDVAKQIRAHPNADIERLKMDLAKKHKVKLVKSATILSYLSSSQKTKLVLSRLRTRLTRTGSGVSPIALMPKPFPCPGKCTYCPTALCDVQISSTADKSKKTRNKTTKEKKEMFAPKSYTGFEPATMRAIQNEYDAKRQIFTRLEQYCALGQPTDKCELIIMGGTFLSVPSKYADNFIKECYDALNGSSSKSLLLAQKKNETAIHRAIGLTIETRPDWCTPLHIDKMLSWGATRVELGVQSLDDKVLEKVKRGHGQKEIISATRDLKNCAFKVCYHFMPGLYSDAKKDISMLKKLFKDSDYCPDMLKIYPCLVMPNTQLYDEYKSKKFVPISAQEAVERIVQATKYFPPWVRVMRMQRDIPASKIVAGVKNGNLHQMVSAELERRGQKCKCIRCREVFSSARQGRISGPLEFELIERSYAASGGIEYFISFEDVKSDVLAGFIRLRFPSGSHRPEVTKSVALIRELHVYGQELAINTDCKIQKNCSKLSAQHAGLGKRLLKRAEQIASDSGKKKICIISGVGTREYYRKLGYSLEGPYMAKRL